MPTDDKGLLGSAAKSVQKSGVRRAGAAQDRFRPSPLDPQEMRALARAIIDTEPSEIRGMLKQDPNLVRGWIVLLKAQKLRSRDGVDVWHDALDHIRLSTLAPLRFAADALTNAERKRRVEAVQSNNFMDLARFIHRVV